MFGKYDNCSNFWCGYKKDFEGYKYGSFLGGKDLMGEDLCVILEEVIWLFFFYDFVKKLVLVGLL